MHRVFRVIMLEMAKMTTLHQIIVDAKAKDDKEMAAMAETEHIRCALEVNRLWGMLGIDTHEMREAIEGMLKTKMEGTDGIS